jgi:hypothetical protein
VTKKRNLPCPVCRGSPGWWGCLFCLEPGRGQTPNPHDLGTGQDLRSSKIGSGVKISIGLRRDFIRRPAPRVDFKRLSAHDD